VIEGKSAYSADIAQSKLFELEAFKYPQKWPSKNELFLHKKTNK
jgi:hypothetical protein